VNRYRRVLSILYWFATVLMVLVSLPNSVHAAKGRYKPGDWTSWTTMRNINDVHEYHHFLYVATDGGIARYDQAERRWLPPLTTSDGLIDRRILRVIVDPKTGDLVYTTPRGKAAFSLYSERHNDVYFFTSEIITALDSSVRAPAKYPSVYAPIGHAFSPEGILTDKRLREYRSVDQVIDFWDNMWFGIRGLGIAMRTWDTARLVILPYSLWKDDIKAVHHFADNFWFVGKGAINVHNRDMDAWAKFEAVNHMDIHSDNVRDVIVDSTAVWLATEHGLSRFDGIEKRWRTFGRSAGLPDEDVLCLAADEDYVWIGTDFGVARLHRDVGIIYDVSHGTFPERKTNDIESIGGAVWTATDRGLFVTRDLGSTWKRFTGGMGMLDAPVTALAADSSRFWCATRFGVAGHDTRTGEWWRYPFPHSYTADARLSVPRHVNSLCAQGNVLWIGTNQGVFKCVLDKNYWRLFTTEDGLIDNRVTDIELDEDYIWFATPAGVTRFYWDDPDRID
jgi:ligand-binding sensor domain-containing protein